MAPGPCALRHVFYLNNFVLAPNGCVIGASFGAELFSACDRAALSACAA